MQPITVYGEVDGKGVQVIWNPGGLLQAHPKVERFLRAVASTVQTDDILSVYPGGPRIVAKDLFGTPEGFMALCNKAFKVLKVEGYDAYEGYKKPEGIWT